MEFNLFDYVEHSDVSVAVFSLEYNIVYSNESYKNFWFDNTTLKEKLEMLKKQENNYNDTFEIILNREDLKLLYKLRIEKKFNHIVLTVTPIEYKDIFEWSEFIVDTKNIEKTFPKAPINDYEDEFSYNILINENMEIEYSNYGFKQTDIKDLFNENISLAISEKINKLRHLESVELEVESKLIKITHSGNENYILNIYPYSKGNFNNYDELTKLKLEVEDLKRELKNKNKLIKAQKKIFENISILDPVTKLYNRNYFYAKLEEAFIDRIKYKYDIEITKIKFTNLKEINENKGLKICDSLLAKTAHNIKENIRRGIDNAFRISSKEIVILSVNPVNEQIISFMEKLKQSFSENELDLEISINKVDSDKSLDQIILEIM